MKNNLQQMSDFFSLLSDPNRLKIILSLRASDKNVSALVEELSMSQSNISHQLALLRRAHLVSFYKNGRKVIYSLDDEHVEKMIDMAFEHARHL